MRSDRTQEAVQIGYGAEPQEKNGDGARALENGLEAESCVILWRYYANNVMILLRYWSDRRERYQAEKSVEGGGSIENASLERS